MAATDSATNGNSNGVSAAQRLAHTHTPLKASMEDVPDEADTTSAAHAPIASVLESADESMPAAGWVPPMSAKAAGKQKAEPTKQAIDTQSEKLFPGLGGGPTPTAYAAPVWAIMKPGQTDSNGVSTNGSSTPPSGQNTPPLAFRGPQSLAGQIQPPLLVLAKDEVLPRNQLKKPIPDILKAINKKLATNLTVSIGAEGKHEFRDSSKKNEGVKNQALRDLGAQIGAKTSAKIAIPKSSKAHVIGKQGTTIKAIQESTGARIQLPKNDSTSDPIDEDDDMIDIVLEGNPVAIQLARKAVAKIANERQATVSSKLKTIPAEFYPFIAGAKNYNIAALEEAHGVHIQIPPHHMWTSQRPPQKPLDGAAPVFLPAADDNHITLAGDRTGVQAARAEIERLANEYRRRLRLDEVAIPRGQHRFIIGPSGIPAEDFFEKTGCGIILPEDPEEDIITVVGPQESLQAAIDFAIQQASVNSTSVDISRQFRNAPGGPRIHARNVTRYLHDRDVFSKIRQAHQIKHIETPITAEGAQPWSLYFDSGTNAIKAQNDIISIVNAYPPSRMVAVPIDEFFHQHLRNNMMEPIQKEQGVRIIVPQPSNAADPVLLVFEGEAGSSPEFQVQRGAPTPQQVQEFRQGLEDARKRILEIIARQGEIISRETHVDHLYHNKLRQFILSEQKKRAADQIAIRVNNRDENVIFRGPAPAVEDLLTKVDKFVQEAIQDEKERDFTLTFDFPQKHANQLIGKGGSFIRDLRNKFDVEINVNDGKVDLKGPPKKAQEAKAHITALGKQWADETTHVLKIEPKYHAELIGSKGANLKKLQDKHKVQIHFPRSQKQHNGDHADAVSDSGRQAPRRQQEPDEIIIKGGKKGADESRSELLDLYQWVMDNSHTAIVSVQAGQIPGLIGQGGKGMDELRAESGANFEIPNIGKDVDPTSKVNITIKGTKTSVALAKKLVESKKQIFDTTVVKTVEIDKKHHRALIGTGGSVLRDIVVGAGGSDDRRELARTVQFPKVEQDGNAIKVEGNIKVVEKIIAKMLEIVAERDSQVTDTIDVPTDKHRSLIGRGGETKKALEAKFKVSIDVPRQGSEESLVKISGLPADVLKAKSHILELTKEDEGVTIMIPRKIHHAIADNGQFFRRIKNEHSVRVDHGGHKLPPKPVAPIPEPASGALPLITDEVDELAEAVSFSTTNLADSIVEGEIPWILRGPAEGVEKVKAILEAAQEQALKNTTIGYLSLPDPKTYRYVIGQGGSKVNSIRKATGCKITVPRDQAKEDAIEIIGTAEGVQKAKDLILKAVKEGPTHSAGGHSGGHEGFGSSRSAATGTDNGSW
jgi:predicted PilT family ATPase